MFDLIEYKGNQGLSGCPGFPFLCITVNCCFCVVLQRLDVKALCDTCACFLNKNRLFKRLLNALEGGVWWKLKMSVMFCTVVNKLYCGDVLSFKL